MLEASSAGRWESHECRDGDCPKCPEQAVDTDKQLVVPCECFCHTKARWVSPDCRDGNCQKCPGQAMNLELDDVVACEHDCHMEAEIAAAPTGEVYGEGYWERGEGSNYHGYGDDPGWIPLAAVLRLYLPVGGTLVELGCASGYFVRRAREQRIKAVGVDVSEYAISKAPADVAEHVSVASATDIAHAQPGRLDGVVSWEMLEHLTMDQIRETLQGIYDALVPGGLTWHKIALDTDNVPGYEHIPFHDAAADATHISLFLPETWRRMFEERGFVHSPHAEDMLNNSIGDRDWKNRFFCYRKPQP